jgi:hypothetical protein
MKLGKKKIGLIVTLSLLMAVTLSGCGWLDRLMNPSSLDSQQAIILIQLNGLPYLDQYYAEAVGEEEAEGITFGYVEPLPTWSAEWMAEDRTWKVEGPIDSEDQGEWYTVWYLNEATSTLSLAGFEHTDN